MNINKEDAMLIDVQYVKANRKEKTPDILYLIWKEIKSGQKHLKVIPEPTMEIHFEKPELRNHRYVKNYIRKEDTYTKVVKHKDIPFAIAKEMGPDGQNLLNQFYATKNPQYIKALYASPYAFGTDIDVRVWYRNQWYKTYDNDKPKNLTKGFMDIETDIMEAEGNNDEHCPIDLVTVIDGSTKTVYTFILTGVKCIERDISHMRPYQQQNELKRRRLYASRLEQQQRVLDMDDPAKYLAEEAHRMFDENYPDFNYNFFFYEDERKMLTHIFELINSLKLDFMQVWNIAYDIPKIMSRLRYLGLDPKEVMCSKDFPVKQCYFKQDNHNFDIKNKGHFFFCSSYTVYCDQMVNYAAIRKGQSELRSHKLTSIAKIELEDEKLDYSEIGSIKTFSYVNWLKYIMYNIKDVLLQYGIEDRTSDCDTFYAKSLKNITPYEDAFKQTKMLRAVQLKSFESQNLIPGPNINAIMLGASSASGEDDENSDKFEGAIVGDSTLIDNFGVPLFGRKSNCLFAYTIDMDMSAFYPSTIRAMNIDPSCLIFKMIIDASQYKPRGGDLPYHGITDVQMNPHNDDSFFGDIGKEVMDNFLTKNYISTGYKWLNLPSVRDVYERLANIPVV